ncbi:MAG: tetratricopeptide repeat protein [Verrucomicrobiales bacterium]|nr:tetratricopeptide repeat protein [Verrucomicrobiales bacterium]
MNLRVAAIWLALTLVARAQTPPVADSGSGTGSGTSGTVGGTTATVSPPVDLSQFQPTDQELLDEAAGFIRQQNPGRAIILLSDLLRFYPRSPLREEAWYRVAACYKDLGRFDEARQTAELLEREFPQGRWRPSVWLLRGELLAAEGQWPEALPWLRKAATAELPAAKLRAHYLLALAADNLGRPAEAREALEFLVARERDNPWLDYARVRLAAAELAAGREERGTALLQAVLAASNDPHWRGEAGVRAGNLAYSRGDYRAAVGFYDPVRRSAAPEFWKQLADLGLVQAQFAQGDYAAAIQVYHETKPNFPDQARAQVLFLIAEAYRLTKQPAPALDLYQFLLDQFPADANAEGASWARILLLQNAASDAALLAETVRFIARFPNSPRLPLVQAMRADAYYAKGDYAVAAPMYAAVLRQPDALPLAADVLAGLYFRAGSACYHLRDYAAARHWLAVYLEQFKDGVATPAVLWLQGQAQLAAQDADGALASWSRLLEQYPKFSQRETALWQAALLAGSRRDYARMGGWLGRLMAEFPRTAHLAEAHYWLAVAREAAGDHDGALAQWIAARNLDAARYYAVATQHVINLLLNKREVRQLRAEVDKYGQWRLKNPQDPAISLEVYEWLGRQLADGAQPADGEAYLRLVLQTGKDPAQRKRVQLALALLMTKLQHWETAVRDWTAYRVNFPEDSNRSAVLEPLARAYIATDRREQARKLAEQILRQNPEGEYNARGRLLLGDLAFAGKQYETAAKIYAAVALLIEHPHLTPLALTKAERAWRLAGNEAKADEALLRLRKQFPDYK